MTNVIAVTLDSTNLIVTNAHGIKTSYPLAIAYAKVEISAADILAAYTTPITLVATPGAGKFLEFVSLTLAYEYGATPYTLVFMGTWKVKAHDDGADLSNTIATNGFIDQSSDQVRITVPNTGAFAPTLNKGLDLVTSGGDPTNGDGVIHAKIAYRVHDTGL